MQPLTLNSPAKFMYRALNPPTIDGTINQNEWKDARRYDISGGAGTCLLFIQFDAQRIYVAADVVGDITNDPENPPAGWIINGNEDDFFITVDGEADGAVTRQGTGNGNPFPRTMGGPTIDRWAVVHGGGTPLAGWILKDQVTPANPAWWNDVTSGPNQGAREPYDYIRQGFGVTFNSQAAHRTYEYSIPYGTVLGIAQKSRVGIAVQVIDKPNTLRGTMPANTDAYTSFQEFLIAQNPTANISAPLLALANSSVTLDGSATFDDGANLQYSWDFGDGNSDTSNNPKPSHIYAVPGTYVVNLTVTDSDGYRDTALKTLLVKEEEGAPATISASPESGEIEMSEGGNITFYTAFDDPNLHLGSAEEGLTMVWMLNGRTVAGRNISSTVSSYDFRTNFSFAETNGGKYAFSVVATDRYNASGLYTGGPLSTGRFWNITVKDTNRVPAITGAEPLDDDVSTNETTAVVFFVTASDEDGDTLAFKWYLDGKAQGTSQPAKFTYLPDPDYNASGKHTVLLEVTDGKGGKAARLWNLTVSDSNRAPVVVPTPAAGAQTVDEGAKTVLSVARTDPDGDATTVQWYLGATGTEPAAVSGATGTSFTFEAAYTGDLSSAQSPYTVKVRVSDAKGLWVEKMWLITVGEVDRPPAALITKPAEGGRFTLNDTVAFESTASDPDGDALVYSWSFGDGKAGVSGGDLARTTRRFTEAGTYAVRLTVSDGTLVAVSTVNITVAAAKVRITKVSFNRTTLVEGDTVEVEAALSNEGNMDSGDLQVKFYLDGRGLLIQTATVSGGIPAGGSDTVTYSWTSIRGTHTFIVEVVPGKGTVPLAPGEGTLSVGEKVIHTPKKPDVSGQSMPGGMLLWAGLILVLVVAVAVAAAVASRRKRPTTPVVAENVAEAGHAPGAGAPATAVAPQPYVQQPPPYAPPAHPRPQPCMRCGIPLHDGRCHACESADSIGRARAGVDELQRAGIVLREAGALLERAALARSAGDFAEAAALAEQAGLSARDEHSRYSRARGAIDEAAEAVAAVSGTADVQRAERLLHDAKKLLAKGRYEDAGEKAAEARVEAKASPPLDSEPAAGTEESAAPGQPACPSCGEAVEDGWKMCPYCDTMLGAPAKVQPEPAPRPKKQVAWGREAEKVAAVTASSGLEAVMEEARELIAAAGRKGLDAKRAENLYGLAVSFQKGGNIEKAQRYAVKARSVVEELMGRAE